MIVLSIIMPPGVAPVYNCIESWAKYEELSIASIFKNIGKEEEAGSFVSFPYSHFSSF